MQSECLSVSTHCHKSCLHFHLQLVFTRERLRGGRPGGNTNMICQPTSRSTFVNYPITFHKLPVVATGAADSPGRSGVPSAGALGCVYVCVL